MLLAAHPLARVASTLTRRRVGHWPRGIRHWDARRSLPYADASVAYVFSAHFIEHLHRDDAVRFLREARRVLVPGGICRVVAPDLGAMVEAYLKRRADAAGAASDALMADLQVRERTAPRRGGLLGWYRRGTDYATHKWMYDAPGLMALFREAGFTGVAERAHLQSDIPVEHLRRVEDPSRVLDGAGVCIEARR